MSRRRRPRPNWPYRFAILAIVGLSGLYIAVQTLIGALTFARRQEGVDWTLALLSSLLDATIAAWFVAVGASIGSFLNVVAYRLPRGQKIGGHSKCPFCGTPISARDNVPVLAWIRLRGRCRVCRLPISVQYPLVELSVAIVFFVVYLSEFFLGGGNLPTVRGHPVGAGGLARIADSSLLFTRIAIYLFALSGLIGAALIAVRGRAVPLTLYTWSLLPAILAAAVRPDVVVLPWRSSEIDGFIELRLDALATLLCGAVLGVTIARLIAPLVYRHFDRTLLSSDPATRGARQFIGAMAVAGALLGWQSVVALAWVVVLTGIAGGRIFHRYRTIATLSDLTVWVWLGLLWYRAFWKPLYWLSPLPESVPVVVRHVAAAVLLVVPAVIFRRVSGACYGEEQDTGAWIRDPQAQSPQTLQANVDEDDSADES